MVHAHTGKLHANNPAPRSDRYCVFIYFLLLGPRSQVCAFVIVRVCVHYYYYFSLNHMQMKLPPRLSSPGERLMCGSLDLGANKKQMQSFVRARDPSFLLPAVHIIEVLLTADLLMEFYELHYIITLSC